MADRRKPPGEDYEVGYGKPPVATRFGKGNPGRRKGSGKKALASSAPATMAAIVEMALLRPRKVRRGEDVVTMSAAELLIERVVAMASSSSAPDNAAALKLMERYLSHLLVAPAQQIIVTYHDAEDGSSAVPSAEPEE